MTEIERDEYPVFRQWFEKSLDFVWKIPPELMAKASPIAKIAEFEKVSFAKAAKSLAMGIADTIAMTEDFDRKRISELDEVFRLSGLPTLSFMRSIWSKKVTKILKREKIVNDDEYYLIKPLESQSKLEASKKQLIDQMLQDYEANPAN